MATRVPRQKTRRLTIPPLIVFLTISALFHVVLFSFLKVDIATETDELVSVQLLNDGPLFPTAPTEQLRKEPDIDTRPMEKEKIEPPKGQVVDIARPENEKRPEDSRFLAKWDSTVPDEKKSAFDKDIPVRGRKLQRLATPARLKPIPDAEEPVLPGAAKERKERIEERIKKGEMAGFDGTAGDREKGAEKEEPGRMSGADTIDRKGQEAAEIRLPRRYFPYFLGNDQALTSPSNDHLKDIPDGDETALNARRFLYADYYNRIKRAVSYHWAPGKVLMVHDPGGNIFGHKDRYTKLKARLDRRGNVIEIVVMSSSGVDVLDREAMEAFKQAAPFPNPPEPLIENDRFTVELGFYVEIR